jgi:CO/xanthine dehydrogenase Mo-binding subunit
MFDGGAYADSAVRITKAAAVDCTGPYNILNVKCDSLCIYTNHPYATAFRGFGHPELTFVVERAMDILTMYMGPHDLLVNMGVCFKKGTTNEEVHEAVHRIETALRSEHPEINRVYIEVESLPVGVPEEGH